MSVCQWYSPSHARIIHRRVYTRTNFLVHGYQKQRATTATDDCPDCSLSERRKRAAASAEAAAVPSSPGQVESRCQARMVHTDCACSPSCDSNSMLACFLAKSSFRRGGQISNPLWSLFSRYMCVGDEIGRAGYSVHCASCTRAVLTTSRTPSASEAGSPQRSSLWQTTRCHSRFFLVVRCSLLSAFRCSLYAGAVVFRLRDPRHKMSYRWVVHR